MVLDLLEPWQIPCAPGQPCHQPAKWACCKKFPRSSPWAGCQRSSGTVWRRFGVSGMRVTLPTLHSLASRGQPSSLDHTSMPKCWRCICRPWHGADYCRSGDTWTASRWSCRATRVRGRAWKWCWTSPGILHAASTDQSDCVCAHQA